MASTPELPLTGATVTLDGGHPSTAYAGWLLQCLGAVPTRSSSTLLVPRPRGAASGIAAWAECGAMALTGLAGGPPLPAQGGAAALAAQGALLALAALHPEAAATLPDARVLGERAAVAGLRRRGRTSVGGATRLLTAADGTVALTLARAEDVAVLPAMLEQHLPHGDPWAAVARWVRDVPAAHAVSRAQLLGLPAGALPVRDLPGRDVGSPFVVERGFAAGPAGPRLTHPLVVDLSSLWAGPLCSSLLRQLGCEVVKVESPARPDGARRGPRQLFDLLHGGAHSVVLELQTATGRSALRDLVDRADLVLTSSRPRALEQLGIGGLHPSARFLSITAYRAGGPWADRVGFGDDTAVAGALVAHDAAGGPVLCADAVADPLTGDRKSVV